MDGRYFQIANYSQAIAGLGLMLPEQLVQNEMLARDMSQLHGMDWHLPTPRQAFWGAAILAGFYTYFKMRRRNPRRRRRGRC